MAEAPAEPGPQTEAAQPAPILTSMEGLDAAMANARQVANAAAAAPPATPAPPAAEIPSAPEPAPAPEAATAQPQPVQPAASDEDAAQEEGDEGAPADQPAKPSRMGRLRDQLTQAETAKRDAETKYQERMAADLKVHDKYRALLGTPQEKEQLEGVLANTASPDFEVQQARTRLAQMKQAQVELAPLWTAAHQDVTAQFIRGLEDLRTLDGMTEEGHQNLYKAPSGVDALRIMHGIGVKAGEDSSKGEIASLKAMVSDLKTKLAARGSQPAPGGGVSPAQPSGLAGLLGPDGLPTEEAIARARQGGLRNVGKPVAA